MTATPAPDHSEAYLVQAFDAHGNILDVDPEGRKQGEPTIFFTSEVGLRPLIDFYQTTRTGWLSDYDAETHLRRRVAYFVLWAMQDFGPGRRGMVCSEIQVTPWGRNCCKIDYETLLRRHNTRNRPHVGQIA